MEIISWTICTTKILESNRRFFHEDGASRRLLRNQHFNVKIEESSRIPSSREKPAGVASCFRLGQEITNVPRLARYGNVNGSPMIRRTNLKSDSLDFARHK